MNAFETLGLPPRLTIRAEEVNDAFRESGKSLHPDAGGDEREFARLREAHAILASPSRRLRHWLETHGITVETRGAVDSQVMDLFATVGDVSQRAEAIVRRRQDTKSALGLALLEKETQHSREEVERALATLARAISTQCEEFSDYQAAAAPDAVRASTSVRNLAFLEKWQAGLRSLYARLV
ncbi:MAG: hypothetical protein ACO3JG_09950 [Luteolibacter sp.]